MTFQLSFCLCKVILDVLDFNTALGYQTDIFPDNDYVADVG